MLPSTESYGQSSSDPPSVAAQRPLPAFFPRAAGVSVERRPADEAPIGRREKLLRDAAERIQAVLLELYDEHGIRAGQVEIDLRYAAYGRTEIVC
jgi:hypothetical protein